MGFFDFKIMERRSDHDQLNINLSKKKTSGHVTGFTFIDKETKQYIIYLPSFEISAYGETELKASTMLKAEMDSFFEHITSLSFAQLQHEMTKMGWEKGIFNKQFSKGNVDIDSALKNFSIEGEIKRITLQAA